MRRPHRRSRSLVAENRHLGAFRRGIRSEDGDTLVELLIAVVILGIIIVPILLAFMTSIMGSATYRKVATMDTVLKSAANEATSRLEQSSTAFTCTGAFASTLATLPFPNTFSLSPSSGYTVEYWNGSSVTSTCASDDPLFVTLKVKGPKEKTASISFIVDDPHARSVASGTTPEKLLFVEFPASAAIGAEFAPPVTVAIVDATNNVVTGDISSMSLSVASGPGALSSTCNPSGIEYYGIYTFSNCSVNASGTYTITAKDGSLTATSGSVVVGPLPTVSVSNNSVSTGGTLVFTATVSGPTGSPTPTGSMNWTITAPNELVAPCSSSTGPTGSSNVATYMCSITGAIHGLYTAAARYPGDSHYEAATGFDSSAYVTAPSRPTSTTFTRSASTVAYGSETTETFSATVTGASGGGYPEGTVQIRKTSNTALICTASLTAASETTDAATYKCSLTVSQLGVGGYTVKAVYSGGTSFGGIYTYTPSTSTSAAFSVTKGSSGTITTLTRSAATVSNGSETAETFSATVTGPTGGGYPEGTVQIRKSATTGVICTAALTAASETTDAATYKCSLTASQLGVGSYTVKAVYGGGTSSTGNYAFTTSTSGTATFTVIQASKGTTTTLTRSAATVAYGSEATETFSATVTGVTGDGYPEGTVQIRMTTTAVICTATLTAASETTHAATYKCSLTASQLGAAGYTVKAVYEGGTSSNGIYTYTTSTSGTVTFTVTKVSKGTTTTLTRSAATVAYGSETTETFSATVTGAATDGYPEGTVQIRKSATTGVICTATLTAASETTHAATYKCTLTASQLGAAGYTVKAVYEGGTSSNGNYTYTTSTSGTVTFTVTKVSKGTTTTLTRSAATVAYGSETTETFSATVTGVSGGGYPEGTVQIRKSATTGVICTATLTAASETTDAATYKCTLTASQLGLGSYTVKAVYEGGTSSNGDYAYTTSTSGTASFTVTKVSKGTTTTLTRSAATVAYGSEATETFSATVTGVTGDGYPEGTVQIRKSATTGVICTATLTAASETTHAATYKCSLTASQLGAAGYTVKAVYEGGTSSNGNYTYTTSTSGTVTFTVTKVSKGTTTTLTRSAATVAYGSETTETFSATVTGAATDGYPEGTVQIRKSATTGVICTATLTAASETTDAATYKCTLTASQLGLGSYTVKAVYEGGTSSNGNYTYTASTSATASFTVKKGSSGTTTTLTRSAATVAYGSETTETFSATVTGVSGGGYPEGTVQIRKSATTGVICTATLTAASETTDAATYKCSLTASQLGAASYTVKAVYEGGTSSNGDYAYTTSTSGTVSFTVTKVSKGTTTTLTRSAATVAYGSETTETFSATVTGVTGDGYPEGTVQIRKSTTTAVICTATLTAASETTHAATYKCSLTASQLGAAGYTVKAVYEGGTSSNGNYTYTTSTSGTVTFTVTKVSKGTTTTLTRSAATVAYGSETTETFSATVTGAATDGYPEGTVQIRKSATTAVICTATLTAASETTDAATYKCTLTASQLGLGSYTVKAVYEGGTSSNGNYTYTASTSATASFTVKKGSSGTTTTLTRSAATVAYGSETTETFSATVTGVSRWRLPRGHGADQEVRDNRGDLHGHPHSGLGDHRRRHLQVLAHGQPAGGGELHSEGRLRGWHIVERRLRLHDVDLRHGELHRNQGG